MTKRAGFTLIELLVVVAIIGVLAAVVSAALNSARQRGNNAAIKSNLAAIRTQAELFYAVNGDYGDELPVGDCPTSGTAMFALDPTIAEALAGASTHATPQCAADNESPSTGDATNWSASAPLADGSGWCVDATGYSGSGTAAIIDNIAVCQ